MYNQLQERIDDLERELQYKSENLQATVEELETSNEELQSSNEELIASNEELQSTNEELQSVNEELYTVNSEHIRKIDELTELNSDIDNLFRNTRIGTIFLDRNLTIRKVNDTAAELTTIMHTDIGRPIKHLSFNNLHPKFIDDVYTVVENLKPIEREVFINNNAWYLIRIIPYRTPDNAVNGIIVLLLDISGMKQSRETILNLTERLQLAMEIGGISWWEWNKATNDVYTGQGKYSMLGYEKSDIEPGYEGWVKLVHPDDRHLAMQAMKKHLDGKARYYETEYRILAKNGEYRWYKDKGGMIFTDIAGKSDILTGVVMDITSEKQREEERHAEQKHARLMLEESAGQYEQLFLTIKHGVVFHDETGRIITANPEAERILGLTIEQMQGLKPIDPNWHALREDGSEFPGDQHPASLSLRTGKPIHNVIMGVFNPITNSHQWLKINAIPLFDENREKPWRVYASFEEIQHSISY